MHGKPLKIINIGEDDSQFRLEDDNIKEIFDKLNNKDIKVAVVSIVGSFRTGKSFILNFFLRYLRHLEAVGLDALDDESEKWMYKEGDMLLEGNLNTNNEQSETSFAWRGGNERQTTGIWMWSEPFIVRSTAFPEEIAVLLMDTQGMFDNQTTMTLTAQIFGLSTLVSSFQIYNVEKRIGEDNLQHLALFSEYGRMALSPVNESNKSEESETIEAKPFQHMQFLIRDYQNFDKDWDDDFYIFTKEDQDSYVETYREAARKYLNAVIDNKEAKDLQITRDQITRCFDSIDCYMLPHPGPAVTKKTFDGKISSIDPGFRALVNIYLRQLFHEQLLPKRINDRFLTAPELALFFAAYTSLFQKGQSGFPKAMTMLEATSEANNRSALAVSLARYRAGMEAKVLVGNVTYVKEDELTSIHNRLLAESLSSFDKAANMGPQQSIAIYRTELQQSIDQEMIRLFHINSLHNPYRDVDRYVVPLFIGVVAYIASKILDSVCSSDICESTEDALERLYMLIFFILLILTWRYFSKIYSYALDLMSIAAKRTN
eukprot:gene18108-23762_t